MISFATGAGPPLTPSIPALAAPIGPALGPWGSVAASESLLSEPDWTTLGLILAIVGSFLLANAILFRNPRALVREHYGARRVPLRTIREFIFHRLQMTLGFAFLLSGFALQLVGRVRPAPVPEPGSAASEFPILWIGLILLLAISLEVVGWWWSLRSFRRYVRAYLRQNPPDFATDVDTAREVGELFGLRSTSDETVQSYAERVRLALGLAARSPSAFAELGEDEEFSVGGLEPAFEED